MRRMLFFVLLSFFLPSVVFGEGIICEKGSVYLGSSKSDVLAACGKPLSNVDKMKVLSGSISGSNKTFGGEVWVYDVGGRYRGFVFIGDVLKDFIHGKMSK